MQHCPGPVPDVEREGGQRDGQRHGQRDQRHHGPADSRPDHRDQVEEGHEHAEQQRVGHAEREQPQVGAQVGDHRGDEVAQHEAADLGEDLVADQDGPQPPRVRHQPVGEHLDLRQANRK